MQPERKTKPFSDEEFLDFTETLSDVFAENYVAFDSGSHVEGYQLWEWWNLGVSMRAIRYVVELGEGSPRNVGLVFIVTAFRKSYPDHGNQYQLTFGTSGFDSYFDSLESLINTITGIVESMKLSAKHVAR